jgi:ankyrin repeat protein
MRLRSFLYALCIYLGSLSLHTAHTSRCMELTPEAGNKRKDSEPPEEDSCKRRCLDRGLENPQESLMQAAIQHDEELASQALARGANPLIAGTWTTPLHYATRSGYVPLVKLFLEWVKNRAHTPPERSAMLNAPLDSQQLHTPLIAAILWATSERLAEYRETVKLLLDAGADVNLPAERSPALLDIALGRPSLGEPNVRDVLTELLIRYGANLDYELERAYALTRTLSDPLPVLDNLDNYDAPTVARRLDLRSFAMRSIIGGERFEHDVLLGRVDGVREKLNAQKNNTIHEWTSRLNRALTYAASHGFESLVRLLLEQNALPYEALAVTRAILQRDLTLEERQRYESIQRILEEHQQALDQVIFPRQDPSGAPTVTTFLQLLPLELQRETLRFLINPQ